MERVATDAGGALAGRAGRIPAGGRKCKGREATRSWRATQSLERRGLQGDARETVHTHLTSGHGMPIVSINPGGARREAGTYRVV